MRNKRIAIAIAAVIVVGIGWYLFRPERLFVSQRVNESLAALATSPDGGNMPTAIAAGRFHGVAHNARGLATVHQFQDGRRVLRFTEFETSNGPELQVYLVAASDAMDSDTVKKAGFISLGALKGNIGDQNYEIPAGVDLEKYRAATVWCRRFSVNFATAPLMPSSR